MRKSNDKWVFFDLTSKSNDKLKTGSMNHEPSFKVVQITLGILPSWYEIFMSEVNSCKMQGNRDIAYRSLERISSELLVILYCCYVVMLHTTLPAIHYLFAHVYCRQYLFGLKLCRSFVLTWTSYIMMGGSKSDLNNHLQGRFFYLCLICLDLVL